MPIQDQPIARDMMFMSANDHEDALAEAKELLELIRVRLTLLGD
jgi:hypothetical protein